ncbi:DUF3263 domain-containing protein [Corynebacterium mustelae]|nr:DUF3263 domain-containing protein [Corynebacterium mustelae]
MSYSVNMLEPSDILSFEESAPKTIGAKEEAIRMQLGISPVRYYQRLNIVIDMPEMMEKYPQLTARLRRIRDQRATERNQT